MKKTMMLSVALMAIICISCSILTVNALNSNEWSFSVSWDKGIYYQGDSSSVTPTFYSNCPDQITISSISIQFDWTNTPTTETVSSPNIATGNQYSTPYGLSFTVPSGASIGSHSYTITYKGQQKGLLGWYDISVSRTGSISVHDAYELLFQQTFSNVQGSLNNAQNINYQSPEARSLLEQANNMYNQAASLANQGKWQDAVNDLNSASSYLSQASAKEAQYTPPTPATPEFPTLAILAGFFVLSLVAVTILTIRKRKITKK